MTRYRLPTLFAFLLVASLLCLLHRLVQSEPLMLRQSLAQRGPAAMMAAADHPTIEPACWTPQQLELIAVRDRQGEAATAPGDDDYVKPAWGSFVLVVGAFIYLWVSSHTFL